MISSYGDQSTTRIILHIIIVFVQRVSIALNARRHLYVLYMQLKATSG